MLNIKKNRIIAATLAASIMISGAPVYAATATGSLIVTATVLASCTVAAFAPVADQAVVEWAAFKLAADIGNHS